jgi:hypothetical protein
MDDPKKWPLAVKREALAQAVARGVKPERAGEQAGFSHPNGKRLQTTLKRRAMAARIAEIQTELTRCLTQAEPLMLQLLDAAHRAMRLDSAAGYSATRGLLAEVARLQSRIEAPSEAAVSPARVRPTREEWLALHGPKADPAP